MLVHGKPFAFKCVIAPISLLHLWPYMFLTYSETSQDRVLRQYQNFLDFVDWTRVDNLTVTPHLKCSNSSVIREVFERVFFIPKHDNYIRKGWRLLRPVPYISSCIPDLFPFSSSYSRFTVLIFTILPFWEQGLHSGRILTNRFRWQLIFTFSVYTSCATFIFPTTIARNIRKISDICVCVWIKKPS